MRGIAICLLLVLTVPTLLAQECTDWTSWWPAQNSSYRDQYGIDHDKTDFSYRWRKCIPCTGKDCQLELQIRNNSEKRESVNYDIYSDSDNGESKVTRDHRNFDPHETQDVSVTYNGQAISRVKIE